LAAAPDPSSVRFPGPWHDRAWHHFDVRANGLKFHAVECEPSGSPDRPLVLLLHGYTEFWWGWRYQLQALTDAGYRAVAVDLRGYGDSDKPPRGYDGWTLAGDTNGLVRSLGHRTATLVGNADGGLVCWATATLHPRVVDRIAVLASPHPRALRRDVLLHRLQRSAFLSGFLHNQLPRLGERRLVHHDARFVDQYFRRLSSPRWQQTADFADTVTRNRAAMQIPYVAHSSLEYRRWAYRSQFRPDGAKFMKLMNRRLTVPVLALRGADDPYIFERPLTRSNRYAARFEYVVIPGSGHFAHQEQPEAVTRQLLNFIGN
jgi:pimeloyl-ACP methyl ester carboxylesterase